MSASSLEKNWDYNSWLEENLNYNLVDKNLIIVDKTSGQFMVDGVMQYFQTPLQSMLDARDDERVDKRL